MPDQLWIIGVLLVVVGSIGNNLGTNLVSFDHKLNGTEGDKKSNASDKLNDIEKDQNKDVLSSSKTLNDEFETSQTTNSVLSSADEISNDSLSDNESRDCSFNEVSEAQKRNSCCSLRVFGVSTFVIGNLLTFAAFGFAAQSLLAALESVQFVSNIAFAKYMHKEIITHRMIIATASIVIGNILVVIFSAHDAGLYTSGDILNLYLTNSSYHAYLIVAFVLWLIFHFTFLKYYNSRVNDEILLSYHDFMEPFAFSVSSAIIGTKAVLQAKCMSMLIQVTARGEINEFEKPTIWVILFAWIFFVVFWLRRLDLGLKLFPPLFIIPVLQVFFVFFAIICGGIFFQEFINFTAGQYVGFVAGVLMILTGVYGLAPVKTSEPKEKTQTPRKPDEFNSSFCDINHIYDRPSSDYITTSEDSLKETQV